MTTHPDALDGATYSTLSARAIAAAVHGGRLSAREITTAALERIAQYDPDVRAFHWPPTQALAGVRQHIVPTDPLPSHRDGVQDPAAIRETLLRLVAQDRLALLQERTDTTQRIVVRHKFQRFSRLRPCI
ncbi:hypothetical protein ACIHFE_29990 [Streptomyces sp. NPDC052396]|uniref:hypothetical protein n=1 Tax=Streptomyces sp. NPDC052396 TaxID=3365689 RepID=UPI0037D0BBB3